MKYIYIILFNLLILTSCNNSRSYDNVTSSDNNIDFYELVEVEHYDETVKIKLSIPSYLEKNNSTEENFVFKYNFFEDKSGYMISLETLESKNTQKLSDKEYFDLGDEWFESLNRDLSEIERVLPPIMDNVKVVQLRTNLIINDKYFSKRVSYYNDKRLIGTFLEGVTCTEFHYVTLHNKKKYTLNIVYYGDDKDVSKLIGLFGTIGGSIKFK